MPRHRFSVDPSTLPIENAERLAGIAQALHEAAKNPTSYAEIAQTANNGLSKSERAFVAGYLHVLRGRSP